MVALALLTSCSSSGRLERGEQAPFHVLAPTAQLQRDASSIVAEVLPEISRALDVPVTAPVFVAMMPECHSAQAKRANAIANSYGVIVYDASPEKLAGHIGHELVHTLARYRVSSWNTLPIVLEEGLCTLVGHGLSGAKQVVIEGYFPRPAIEQYLSTKLGDLHALEGEPLDAAYLAATYMAAVLGFSKLQELTQRAHAAGHATIPTPWVLNALEDVERLRHADGPEPAPHVVDPLFGVIETETTREQVVRIQVSFPDHPFQERPGP